MESTGERYLEAELHRLQGEMLLAQSPSNHGPAEGAFQKALAVAGAQQAKSLELRAAMSLARLWHDQGKTTEARDLLSPVYLFHGRLRHHRSEGRQGPARRTRLSRAGFDFQPPASPPAS